MTVSISDLFDASSSGVKGIANVFVSVGTVIGVDPNTLTCTVLSNQGLLEDVRMTFPQMSNATGVYALPNIGDICALSFTVQGTPYIIGYGAYNAIASLKNFDRINLEYNSVVLTSNKRSMLSVSDDIHLVTMTGNHLLLNNNPSNPAIVLEGSKRITIRTGIDPDASTIDIIKEFDSKKTTLSIRPNGESSAALSFEFEGGKITMNITQELTVKVSGGDGTNFVTAKHVKDYVDSAITWHSHSSSGQGQQIPGSYPLFLTGITNLKTESA